MPDARECLGEFLATCNADGTARTFVDCADDNGICVAGEDGADCRARVCEPDSVVCDGNAVRACDSRGAGTLLIPCGDGLTCSAGGCVVATGQCPVAAFDVLEGDEVTPHTLLHLSAERSTAYSGSIERWEWSVVQPDGAVERFSPDAARAEVSFEANVVGLYTFRLRVWDGDGVESCVPAEQEVTVIPDTAIHVELTWATSGDPDAFDTGLGAGSDLDLHLLHPSASQRYFHSNYDCFWRNPNPNWGGSGTGDNPNVLRSDVDGGGPESIAVELPEFGATYRVGVHQRYDWGFGPSRATVRVYIYGSLVQEWPNVELNDLDLWDALTIGWPSQVVNRVGSGTTPLIQADVELPPAP